VAVLDHASTELAEVRHVGEVVRGLHLLPRDERYTYRRMSAIPAALPVVLLAAAALLGAIGVVAGCLVARRSPRRQRGFSVLPIHSSIQP